MFGIFERSVASCRSLYRHTVLSTAIWTTSENLFQ